MADAAPDEDELFEDEPRRQRFSQRSKHHQRNKTTRTHERRRAGAAYSADMDALPVGQVVQVHSRFVDVELAGAVARCVVRKTLLRARETTVVVGDRVRVRQDGSAEAVIEDVLPRATVLTRADSFRQTEQHPIVANAAQMLIVASLREPRVKWGLVDRMLIAAQSGGLAPLVCLNKIDLAGEGDDAESEAALRHYAALGVATARTSVARGEGIAALADLLRGRVTVLAGHSGVGKSSLIRAVEPGLDLRVGEVSAWSQKGRHTTTSARRYDLAGGGAVIDTPGVKLFGLWGITRDNLDAFFPDVVAGSAPEWRAASRLRILESLPEPP